MKNNESVVVPVGMKDITANMSNAMDDRMKKISAITDDVLRERATNVINAAKNVVSSNIEMAVNLSAIRKTPDVIKACGYGTFDNFVENVMDLSKKTCNQYANIGDTMFDRDGNFVLEGNYSIGQLIEIVSFTKLNGVDDIKALEASGKISDDMSTKKIREAVNKEKEARGQKKTRSRSSKPTHSTIKPEENVSRETKPEAQTPNVVEPMYAPDVVEWDENHDLRKEDYMAQAIQGILGMASYEVYNDHDKLGEKLLKMATDFLNVIKDDVDGDARKYQVENIAAMRETFHEVKNAR